MSNKIEESFLQPIQKLNFHKKELLCIKSAKPENLAKVLKYLTIDAY